jgi:hypothetical protein
MRKSRFVRLLTICIALSFWCGCARPREIVQSPGNTAYYVDSETGSDQNDGMTPEKAWKSLDRVNRTIFAAGDKILFKAGSRFSGQLSPLGSGKEGAPIVIDTYGTGAKPLIAAEGKYHEALLVKNQEYWEVNNLELTNEGWISWKYRYGVRVAAWDFGTMHHIHLKNLFVHDVNGSVRKGRGEGQGIVWENGGEQTKSRFDDLLIEGCHLVHTDRNGICGYSEHSERTNWFPSLRVVVRNNLLEDIGGDGIKPWGCDGCLVEHNRLFRGGQRCPDYSAGIWPWSCDHTVIQFNEVSQFKGTRDGEAFDSDGNCCDTVFQYNYSHENDGGFIMLCDDGSWKMPDSAGNRRTVIRYNISQNDRARIFHITGPIHDARIYNNVIFMGKELDIPLFLYTDYNGWSDGIYVANNIFFAEGKCRYSHGVSRNWNGTYNDELGLGGSTNNRFESNVYFGNHANPPQDPKAIMGDPGLAEPGKGKVGIDTVEGYKLKEGSPCIRAGVIIKDNGGQDFWGNRIPEDQNPDIGAHQK